MQRLAIFLWVWLIQNCYLNTTGLTASVVTPTKSSSLPAKKVLHHTDSFRQTSTGELSVASLNILAPTLHSLSEPEETRAQYASLDRQERVPMSFKIAKRINADILSLQEVEGVEHIPALEKLLSCDEIVDGVTIKGYDSYMWSPLLPHRVGEVVGLCVAWRSDRHTLVSSHGFRRGLVVQLQEVGDGATFCIGNVHLPARPSEIYGRLKAASTLCKRIEDCRPHKQRSASPLDGAAIVTGDFNCDATCSPVSLMMDGFTPQGTIFERNYRQKISKKEAKKFQHGLRFLDAYGPNLRKSQASITVSLSGRGPGSMDHILYMPGRWGKTRAASRAPILDEEFASLAPNTSAARSRRQKRRLRSEAKVETRISLAPPSLLRVNSVLATIDPDDEQRTQVIVDGLPNLAKGFPTDHLPVGVLLESEEVENEAEKDFDSSGSFGDESLIGEEAAVMSDKNKVEEIPSPVSKRRKSARSTAVTTRQRHNALLRAISTWLMARGVEDIIRDQPLYQWKWVDGMEYLKKKMRAPDICCVAPFQRPKTDVQPQAVMAESVMEGVLMMVEVTVSKSPTSVRKHKEKKYRDLAPTLSAAPKVQDAKLSVPDAFVVVISEEGTLPTETLNTLESMALLTSSDGASSQQINDDVKWIALELLRIRNHWTD